MYNPSVLVRYIILQENNLESGPFFELLSPLQADYKTRMLFDVTSISTEESF